MVIITTATAITTVTTTAANVTATTDNATNTTLIQLQMLFCCKLTIDVNCYWQLTSRLQN